MGEALLTSSNHLPPTTTQSPIHSTNQSTHLHRLRLWVDVDEHERLARAPQAGLQQVRELGVAVGDVGRLSRQRLEHITQAGQALVDVAGLLGTLALCVAARQALAARGQGKRRVEGCF